MTPVLFLDMQLFWKRPPEQLRQAFTQLHEVAARTGCGIVVDGSTGHVFNGDIEAAETTFRRCNGYNGAGSFIGFLPLLGEGMRGLEIAAWVASQPRTPSRWAVVAAKDAPELDIVRSRLVLDFGLDDGAAERLIALLSWSPLDLVPSDAAQEVRGLEALIETGLSTAGRASEANVHSRPHDPGRGRFRVWDALNGDGDDDGEHRFIDADMPSEAAEAYAEHDQDGLTDGLYNTAHPVVVREPNGTEHLFHVSAETVLTFHAVGSDSRQESDR